MKKLKYSFLLLLWAAILSTGAFATYGPQNLTIPDSAEAVVYGQSGAGRNLMSYRFGHGDNVIVLGFAIHGYEDNWTRDGEALVYTAGQLMQRLDQNMDTVEDWGWSVYVLPCMNPDGLLDGYTNNGPGRCTTTYYKNGSLAATWGVDMNRSFPTAWSQRTSDRNWTGSAPLACKESQALAQFVQNVKGSGTNLCIDTHGWMSQIITSNGYSKLYDVFKARFPGNTYANCNNGGGYFTAYTASLGYASCLFEFPDGLYSMSAFKNSGYCEKYVDCVMELLTQYGTYAPKPVEPEPVEPEPEDPHLSVCPTKDYQDVPQNVWYHEAVDYVVDTGIMTGAGGAFRPDACTTRAEMVEALWRSMGAPQPDQLSPLAYSDISDGMYCADAVRWATQNSIINGYLDGTFRPDQQVSRQELATILWRMAGVLGRDVTGGVSLEQFPDGSKVGSYALEAVQWAVGQGYIHGSDEGSQILLLPEGGATRAQMATILMRYCGGAAAAQVTAAAPETVQEPNLDADGEDLEGN